MTSATKERRKHRRYAVANTIAVNPEGAFQVVDVSLGGFCFKCPPYTNISDQWLTDILTSTGALEAYPVKKAWANVHENGSSHLPALLKVGVRFNSLAKDQKSRLAKLIRSISDMDLPHINKHS